MNETQPADLEFRKSKIKKKFNTFFYVVLFPVVIISVISFFNIFIYNIDGSHLSPNQIILLALRDLLVPPLIIIFLKKLVEYLVGKIGTRIFPTASRFYIVIFLSFLIILLAWWLYYIYLVPLNSIQI